MKRSSSIFLTATAWSVLVSLTAMLHHNCYDLFLPPAIWVQPFIPIELSCSSLWNNSLNQCFSWLGFCGCVCFFFRVSLFSVCGCWISHCEPRASPRSWNIPMRCGIISGQTAWVHHSSLALLAPAASQAPSPLCLCLVGFSQSVSKAKRASTMEIICVCSKDSVKLTYRKFEDCPACFFCWCSGQEEV